MIEPSMPNQPPQEPAPPQQSHFSAEVYVQQALQLLELNVSSEQLPSVIENFERVRTLAQPVLDFPLSDDLEAAPIFEP